MDAEEVLKLLEQRSKERRDRATPKAAATPEERIAAQIDSSMAAELDALIAEIRAKLSQQQQMPTPTPLEVLLVEDSTSDTGLIEEITEHGSAPIRITTANDCSGALARLSDVRFIPNRVIADMRVLEFGGVELLKRCNPREIPVVVFSGSIDPADQARAMRLGAKEFVNKPTALDDYVDAISGMIDKWGKPGSVSA